MTNGQTSGNGSRVSAWAQTIVAAVAVVSMFITLMINAGHTGESAGALRESIENLHQKVEELGEDAASRERVNSIETRVAALEAKQATLATFREEVLSRLTRIETKLSERLSYEPTHGEVERN